MQSLYSNSHVNHAAKILNQRNHAHYPHPHIVPEHARNICLPPQVIDAPKCAALIRAHIKVPYDTRAYTTRQLPIPTHAHGCNVSNPHCYLPRPHILIPQRSRRHVVALYRCCSAHIIFRPVGFNGFSTCGASFGPGHAWA